MDEKLETQQPDIKYLICWLLRLPWGFRIIGHGWEAHL